MRKSIQYIFIVFVMLLAGVELKAQDAHFSQYFSSPHLVNPAFTSLFQGDIRIIMNHRSQWGSILDNPYETLSFAGDFKLHPTKGCDYIGLGTNLLIDRAGDINFRTVQGNLSMAYFKSLNSSGTNYLSLGFSTGMAQRKIDYMPEDFLDYPEVLPNEKFRFFDLSAGMLWYYYPKRVKGKDNYYYAGFAIHHLNNPEQSHFADSYPFAGSENQLAKKYVLHGGVKLDVSDKVDILPSLLIQVQKPAYEVNFGSFVKYKMNKDHFKETFSMYLGAFYRYNDALVLAYRVDIYDYYLTFSYDLNMSGLTASTNGAGGFEITVAAVFFNSKKKICPSPIDCPKF